MEEGDNKNEETLASIRRASIFTKDMLSKTAWLVKSATAMMAIAVMTERIKNHQTKRLKDLLKIIWVEMKFHIPINKISTAEAVELRCSVKIKKFCKIHRKTTVK